MHLKSSHSNIYVYVYNNLISIRLLNAELEAKTADLVRQAEQLMVSCFSVCITKNNKYLTIVVPNTEGGQTYF